MWPKFGKSNISMKEVIFDFIMVELKNRYIWGVLLFQVQ